MTAEVPTSVKPDKTIAMIDAKIARTANARHRKMLENFREHVVAEVSGADVEEIMKTQVAEPYYQFWGLGIGDFGPKGGEAVRKHYQKLVDKKTYRLQHDFEFFMIDDNHIFIDGMLHMQWPGKALRDIGVMVDDPDADYIYSYRSANVFKYDDDGNCLGEDAWSDGMPNLERCRKIEKIAA